MAAGFEDAGVAEGLEEAVEVDLGLAFFVAGDVVADPGDEMSKLFLSRHGALVQEDRPRGNSGMDSL